MRYDDAVFESEIERGMKFACTASSLSPVSLG
jgi:hypothetical protein